MDASLGPVLVVDDNPGDARLVAWALAHEPGGAIESERADRVASAVERLRAARFAVVLLDLGLPDSRGADGVARLRAAAPTVPVVVLSGAEEPERVRRALAAGAQDYLVKGIFPPGRLASALRNAIFRQRLERELAEGRRTVESALAAAEAFGTPMAYLPPAGPLGATTEFRRRAVGESASDRELTQWVSAAVLSRAGEGGSATNDSPGTGGPALIVRPGAGADGRAVLLWWRGEPSPSVAASDEDPGDPIDPEAWRQLVEMAAGDRSFVPALVAAFLAEAPSIERSVMEAARRGDAEAIAHGAHTLKSACAQVGALALARRWSELERAADRGASRSWEEALRPILEDARRVEAALRARAKSA